VQAWSALLFTISSESVISQPQSTKTLTADWHSMMTCALHCCVRQPGVVVEPVEMYVALLLAADCTSRESQLLDQHLSSIASRCLGGRTAPTTQGLKCKSERSTAEMYKPLFHLWCEPARDSGQFASLVGGPYPTWCGRISYSSSCSTRTSLPTTTLSLR